MQVDKIRDPYANYAQIKSNAIMQGERGPQEPWGEQKGDLSGVAFANEHRANFAICRAGNEVGAAFAKSKERTPPALFSLDLLQVSLSLSYRSDYSVHYMT
jgi:hypothetical protein